MMPRHEEKLNKSSVSGERESGRERVGFNQNCFSHHIRRGPSYFLNYIKINCVLFLSA